MKNYLCTKASDKNNSHIQITYFDKESMEFKQHEVTIKSYENEQIEREIQEFIKKVCKKIKKK